MILTIDIGNTRVKCAVFEHFKLLKTTTCQKQDFIKSIQNLLNNYSTIKDTIISSVGNIAENDLIALKKIVNVIFIDTNTKLPFDNLYTTPKTLGIDRMVLAAGAVYQFPLKNRLIIDAGTCVTYDFVNSKNQYLGGAISPGLQLRYASLHNYTAKLPLLSITNPDHTIGNSTMQAMHSGVVNGLLHEINGFINAFEAENLNFIIILTGGDAEFLAKRLKNTDRKSVV